MNMYENVFMYDVCMFSPAVLGNKEMNAKADLALVLESTDGMYGDFVSNSSTYLDARGLRANSFSLNGIVIEDHSITANVMQLLGRYIHTYIHTCIHTSYPQIHTYTSYMYILHPQIYTYIYMFTCMCM